MFFHSAPQRLQDAPKTALSAPRRPLAASSRPKTRPEDLRRSSRTRGAAPEYGKEKLDEFFNDGEYAAALQARKSAAPKKRRVRAREAAPLLAHPAGARSLSLFRSEGLVEPVFRVPEQSRAFAEELWTRMKETQHCPQWQRTG